MFKEDQQIIDISLEASVAADAIKANRATAGFFIDAHKHLSQATYAGRGEEFSTWKFRINMLMVSARNESGRTSCGVTSSTRRTRRTIGTHTQLTTCHSL